MFTMNEIDMSQIYPISPYNPDEPTKNLENLAYIQLKMLDKAYDLALPVASSGEFVLLKKTGSEDGNGLNEVFDSLTSWAENLDTWFNDVIIEDNFIDADGTVNLPAIRIPGFLSEVFAALPPVVGVALTILAPIVKIALSTAIKSWISKKSETSASGITKDELIEALRAVLDDIKEYMTEEVVMPLQSAERRITFGDTEIVVGGEVSLIRHVPEGV